MILEKLQLPGMANLELTESGYDSFHLCPDKKWFLNFPHKISYSYNNRGFRDQPWPDPLPEVIWCVGDSFTVGLGSPLHHTWAQVLQQKTNSRIINISMDGASNQWINRKVNYILEEVRPKNIVIMWSYTHRRELPQDNLSDMERRMWIPQLQDVDGYNDYMNFKGCITDVCKNAGSTNIIHLAVPKFFNNGNTHPSALNKIKNFLGPVEILDYARDSHHFDILTANEVTDKIIPLLST